MKVLVNQKNNMRDTSGPSCCFFDFVSSFEEVTPIEEEAPFAGVAPPKIPNLSQKSFAVIISMPK